MYFVGGIYKKQHTIFNMTNQILELNCNNNNKSIRPSQPPSFPIKRLLLIDFKFLMFLNYGLTLVTSIKYLRLKEVHPFVALLTVLNNLKVALNQLQLCYGTLVFEIIEATTKTK